MCQGATHRTPGRQGRDSVVEGLGSAVCCAIVRCRSIGLIGRCCRTDAIDHVGDAGLGLSHERIDHGLNIHALGRSYSGNALAALQLGAQFIGSDAQRSRCSIKAGAAAATHTGAALTFAALTFAALTVVATHSFTTLIAFGHSRWTIGFKCRRDRVGLSLSVALVGLSRPESIYLCLSVA